MATFKVGDKVIWHRSLRGGYGYYEFVHAEVVAVLPTRIRIRAEKRDGTFRETKVKPESLFMDYSD